MKLPPGDKLRFVSVLSSKEVDPDLDLNGQLASAPRQLLDEELVRSEADA